MDNTNMSPSTPAPTPPPPSQQPVAKSGSEHHVRNILSTVLLFLIAPLIALVLTFFVIRSYEVDGPSMEKTLDHGDLLILNKLPKTIARITGNDFLPDRYSIIIFERSETSFIGTPENRQLVKRVIGLPGERVVVHNGKVTVYNQENPKGFNPDKDQTYAKSLNTTMGEVDVTVNEDEVFVLGDNRPNSLDSRHFGPIKLDDIVGELVVRIFPVNKVRKF